METIVNFYAVLDENGENKKELKSQITSDNPIFINIQSGDTIIPKEGNEEYMVLKTVRNFAKEELDVYIRRIKSKDEVMDEIEELANKTVKSVLDSIKDTFDLDKKNGL